MGTWFGHLAPGLYMFGASIWWLVRSLQEYYRKPENYRNSAGKPTCGCPCRRRCLKSIHVEGFLMVIGAITGILCEAIAGFIHEGYVPMVNIHHLTMYSGFGVAGLLQVLQHHNVRFVPKKCDYMALITALTIMLTLFVFHLHGRAVVDTHLHMLLVYSIAACILAAALEMYFDKSIQAAIARSYCFMLQGSWLIDMAFLIYHPLPSLGAMDLEKHENIMVTTLIFAWHMIGCMIAILLLSGVVYCCCGRQYFKERDCEDSAHTKLLTYSKQNGFHDSKDGGINDGYNSVDEYEEDNLFEAPQRFNAESNT